MNRLNSKQLSLIAALFAFSICRLVVAAEPTIRARPTTETAGSPAHRQPAQSDSQEKTYIEHFKQKLLKVYFPPRGPFNFAGSTLKIAIDSAGTAKLVDIVQPPMLHGKKSASAELCLRSAVKNVNPLGTPPKDMKLPVQLMVKFVPESNDGWAFRCEAKRL